MNPPHSVSMNELVALAEKLDAALQQHLNSKPEDLRRAHENVSCILLGHTGPILAALRAAASPDREAIARELLAHGEFGTTEGSNRANALHCADAIIARFPAPPSVEGAEPVAWRWKPKDSTTWIYDPTPEWLAEHRHEVDAEPLYAAPPARANCS